MSSIEACVLREPSRFYQVAPPLRLFASDAFNAQLFYVPRICDNVLYHAQLLSAAPRLYCWHTFITGVDNTYVSLAGNTFKHTGAVHWNKTILLQFSGYRGECHLLPATKLRLRVVDQFCWACLNEYRVYCQLSPRL